jgi:hypothetical protein
MRRCALALLTAGLLLGLPGQALADQETDSSATTTATLAYDRDGYRYSDLRLTIVRDGQVLRDAPVRTKYCPEELCSPGAYLGRPSVTVRDLDADGEPEVLLPLFSGGTHCCTSAQVLYLNESGTGYRVTTKTFGNMSFDLKNLDARGRPELVSADDRFSYRFSCYACSGNPVRIYRYDNGRFLERTRLHAPQVRSDSRRWHRIYREGRGEGDVRGLLAAWAANEYRLGNGDRVRRELSRALRRGWLSAQGDYESGKHGRAYVRDLHGFLRRAGYKSRAAQVNG